MSFYILEQTIMTTWKVLYNLLVVPFLYGLFHIAKLFNAKIRRGIAGRRDLFEHLAINTASFRHKKRIWFHASSLGEFEQAKPIIVA